MKIKISGGGGGGTQTLQCSHFGNLLSRALPVERKVSCKTIVGLRLHYVPDDDSWAEGFSFDRTPVLQRLVAAPIRSHRFGRRRWRDVHARAARSFWLLPHQRRTEFRYGIASIA